MPKEKGSLWGMIVGDEPGPFARVLHTVSGGDEGSWGEKCIAQLLRNRIADAAFFQNVYVPLNNKTAELDLVMVSRSGIYIFESKAFGGKIYGHPDHMHWTQYLGGTKNSFYNPVKQNENHCRYLSRALQIPWNSTFSFVVFENRTDLSKVFPLSGAHFVVCNRNHLLRTLKNILSARTSVFSEERLTQICNQLREWSCADSQTKQQHIQQVQTHMFGDICPVCGKRLVSRNGKYGAFLGCSGYPKCTYTREK